MLAAMWRRRLKDAISSKRNSPFAPFVSMLLVVMSALAVCISLGLGRGMLDLDMSYICGCGHLYEHDCQVTLTTTANQRYYWNKEGPYSIEDFGPRFQAWIKTAKRPQVLIAADETARFGDSVRLLDEAQRQGVTSARFETRTRPSP